MNLGLAGRRVAVTGASKGIGAGLAHAFANEGARLHLVARSRDTLNIVAEDIRKAVPHADITVHPADLSKASDRERLAVEIETLDILVNNAGAIPGGSIDQITLERLREAWELKVFGYIDLCRTFYRKMFANRQGVIVNNIGNSGDHVDAAYIAGTTGNAALMAFTKALGGHSLDHGVRVLGINPGPVRTERMVTLMKNRAIKNFGDESRYAELQSKLPGGRPATVEEIADAILFLSSQRASYISGTILTIDGGAGSRGSIYAK